MLRQRMLCQNQLLQPRIEDMCINLCGREIRMAKKGLDHPQIRAVLQQMGRECVAEHMGRHPRGLNAGLERQLFDQV